jgi:hypothetical protein
LSATVSPPTGVFPHTPSEGVPTRIPLPMEHLQTDRRGALSRRRLHSARSWANYGFRTANRYGETIGEVGGACRPARLLPCHKEEDWKPAPLSGTTTIIFRVQAPLLLRPRRESATALPCLDEAGTAFRCDGAGVTCCFWHRESQR